MTRLTTRMDNNYIQLPYREVRGTSQRAHKTNFAYKKV